MYKALFSLCSSRHTLKHHKDEWLICLCLASMFIGHLILDRWIDRLADHHLALSLVIILH